MDFNIPPIGGPQPQSQPAPVTTGAGPADFSAALAKADSTQGMIPASPPEDVIDQMHAAAEVADKLRSLHRELHFEPLGNGRIEIQVRDLNGHVIRTIPPSQALQVAAGAPLP